MKKLIPILLLAVALSDQCFAQTVTDGLTVTGGNVGIGATSPNILLNVAGPSGLAYGNFNGYSGTTVNAVGLSGGTFPVVAPNNIVPQLLVNAGSYSGTQTSTLTNRGGIALGGGVGMYSLNPNPAGSPFYGDIRFYTTVWNGSGYDVVDRLNIDYAGNVGIGTTEPGKKLTVKGEIQLSGYPTGVYFGNAQSLSDNGNGGLQLSTFQNNTDITISPMKNLLLNPSGNVGIGTATPTNKLTVIGTISANEIKVTTTGADYVFENDYKLRPLAEVESFIAEHKHLPEMMSAKAMQADGMPVSEVVTKQLAKIEELTLYAIAQKKEAEAARAELNDLKNRMERLEKALADR